MGTQIYMLMRQDTSTGEVKWINSFTSQADAEDAGRQLVARKPPNTYYFIITGQRYG